MNKPHLTDGARDLHAAACEVRLSCGSGFVARHGRRYGSPMRRGFRADTYCMVRPVSLSTDIIVDGRLPA